ncbi:MAG: molybdopterin molybdotransferase MoeA [Actinomycetota bacterium]
MTEPMTMDDARRRILDAVEPPAPIELPLAEAFGCVAATEVATEYDIPPFSAAEVEGVAVRSADIAAATAEAPVELRLAGRVVAGRPPEVTVGWGEAVRIEAGAPVPTGADCVVPANVVAVQGEQVGVMEAAAPGANINPAGGDLKAGSVLVPAGRRLSGAELGILAAAGYGTVLAHPKLRVGVIAVGDFVEPGRPTGLGQVRDATSYALLGAIRDVGAVPYRIGIVRETVAALREALLSDLSRADACVCAGPVGPGGALGEALSGLGEIHPYRVAAHPAEAYGYGVVEGMPFFTVSAKPLAAFVSFEVLVRPAVLKMMGRRDLDRPSVAAVLEEGVAGPQGVTLFVPARVSHREGAWRARPTGSGSPSLLGQVVEANGLAVIPPGDGPVPAGTEVRVRIFRPLER